MNEEVMNEVVTTEAAENESTEINVRQQVQDIIFQTLKNKIKGHIYVKVEERTDDATTDSVFTSIINFGIKYDYRMSLEGKTYEMIAANSDYAVTLALMIFDNYKQFIENKMFIIDKRVKPFKRFQK